MTAAKSCAVGLRACEGDPVRVGRVVGGQLVIAGGRDGLELGVLTIDDTSWLDREVG